MIIIHVFIHPSIYLFIYLYFHTFFCQVYSLPAAKMISDTQYEDGLSHWSNSHVDGPFWQVSSGKECFFTGKYARKNIVLKKWEI